ncbi:MAG: ATP-binding protein [Kiritimatiellales bacterium]|nr:ATP-binding protein [Kiritimatiellales bacterium]
MNVLVADDSQPIRNRLVERLLRIDGVHVAAAEDTAEALRQIETFRPDVAILDVRMPGGGGIKALGEIKARHPETTVMIMTNYPYAQYRRKCLDAGADFFFDKSTEFEKMAATIQEMMKAGLEPVARRTAAVQLVEAKEALEKLEQRQRDLSLLSLFHPHADPETLKEVHTMWERTFDAIPDLVALFDADHRIIRVNKAMAEKLDRPAAELTGKRCYEYMHGTTCPIDGCPHEAMLKDGVGHETELHDEQSGGWLSVSVTPVKEGGRLIGAIHIARDISKRRQIENDLRESEQRYRCLFESMQAGFALHEMIFDKKGDPCDYRFLEVNAAFEKLTGLHAQDLVGRTVKEVLPFTESYWIKTYGQVVLTGIPIQIDDFSGALGRLYSVAAYSPRKGQFATIFTDITEQKNAEEIIRQARDTAEEANRAKTQLLANMSHELRTPLNAVIGLTELLKISPLDEEQLDYVNTISTSGESLLMLISDLLDFSKIEMGKLKINNGPLSVRDAVKKAVSLLSTLAESKKIELTCVITEDLPEQIISDASRLQQVLINLLNNALKFTDKGFVKLTAKRRLLPSGSIRIEFAVEDSGEGMNEVTVQKIFQPFQQGDNSNTREHGGSGLGLAISKNLVEQMGGTIRVESHAGKGSTFTFDVLDQTPLQNPASAYDVRSQWSGRCVYVWSDDAADLRAAEYLLERCGALPRYKETLKEINDCLTQEIPADTVLCNIDMSGLAEKLPEFRKVRPEVQWIAFSSWTAPLDEKVKNCFSAFIDRPLRPEQLYTALTQISQKQS